MSAESFLADALSITRVAPAGPNEQQDAAAHAALLAEMARLYRRR